MPLKVGAWVDYVGGSAGWVVDLTYDRNQVLVKYETGYLAGRTAGAFPSNLRHSPPPEVKPSERAREEKRTMCPVPCVACHDEIPDIEVMARFVGGNEFDGSVEIRPLCRQCGDPELTCDADLMKEFETAPPHPVHEAGRQLCLIEAMRRDFSVLEVLAPGMTPGDIRRVLGE